MEEVEALYTKKWGKKQDNLCKKNEVKAGKLALIAKVKEKEKTIQKAILELEKA